MNLVQTPWNFVEEFGIAGNPNKGHSVCSQLDQTEPRYCRRIPSIFASLSHGLCSRSRARVALGSELQLPMSFPWSVFPGLDQDLFPPMVFLVFWDSIPKRCKGVHCVDLGESFPMSIYLQKSASIQPRTSPSKFGENFQFNIHFTPYSAARSAGQGVERRQERPRLLLRPPREGVIVCTCVQLCAIVCRIIV